MCLFPRSLFVYMSVYICSTSEEKKLSTRFAVYRLKKASKLFFAVSSLYISIRDHETTQCMILMVENKCHSRNAFNICVHIYICVCVVNLPYIYIIYRQSYKKKSVLQSPHLPLSLFSLLLWRGKSTTQRMSYLPCDMCGGRNPR